MKLLVSALMLTMATTACGGDIKTAQDCEAAGHIVRPSPGPRAQCLDSETEVTFVPFGIEGAACCAQN